MQRALGAAVAAGSAALPVQARLVAPPRYTLQCACRDKAAGVALLARAVAAAAEEIRKHPGGALAVAEAPHIVDESDADKAVAQLVGTL